MCGICGVLSLQNAAVDPDLLRGMVARLRHRGPDETGFYHDHQVGFGHARLSIIDLAGGRQPMTTGDQSVCIAFNGEIFNYVELREELIRKGHHFATHSDTEVILHLYQEEGEHCVQRLNGQWAFAIWDAPKQKLFLSRDRLGVRPLFYTQVAGKFLFASEIKALLACPDVLCELDLETLGQIFTFWVTLPPRTAFKNIWQLPPGHSLTLQTGALEISRHWRLQYPRDGEFADGKEGQLAEELLTLLMDATRIRLRSDVPVGTYLSGGLDSSFTTALTNIIAGDRLRSFSVSFDDAEYDESQYQREASAFLKTQHSDVRCSGRDIAEVFPDVIRHAEQPILRTAPAPLFLLSDLVRSSGFKVVLTGEGSDEVLGGYDIFKEAKIRRFWARQPDSRRRPLLLKRLYPYMEAMQNQPLAYLQHFFRIKDEDVASPFFSHLPRWELTSKLKTFFSDDVTAELRGRDLYRHLQEELPAEFSRWPALCQAQYLETMYLLPGYILSSQGDRMAMAHSVEARYPFLDYRVVEFAAKLHPSQKMRVLNEKYLLKRIANGRLPASIVGRAKQPYRAPDGPCFFQAAAKPYVDELMSARKLAEFGVFRPESVAVLMAKFRSGRAMGAKDNMALVGILSTQLLIQQFVHDRAGESSCQHYETNYAPTS